MNQGQVTAAGLWENACAVIKNKIPQNTYAQWFECIVPVRMDQDKLVLGVSDDIYAQWVENNFSDVISEGLNHAAGKPLKFHIETGHLKEIHPAEQRDAVEAFHGLTPCPFSSGTMNREQGISKAGRKSLRKMAVECAWLWYRWQPDSWLVKKWKDRLEQKGRIRRTAIVAMARQLLVALWRYVVKDEAIEGAIINKPIEV